MLILSCKRQHDNLHDTCHVNFVMLILSCKRQHDNLVNFRQEGLGTVVVQAAEGNDGVDDDDDDE